MPQLVVEEVPVPEVQTVEIIVEVLACRTIEKLVPAPQVSLQQFVVPMTQALVQEVVK